MLFSLLICMHAHKLANLLLSKEKFCCIGTLCNEIMRRAKTAREKAALKWSYYRALDRDINFYPATAGSFINAIKSCSSLVCAD